jgi:ABC-type transport system involved in multi-copper enzyme maturation permease subunit
MYIWRRWRDTSIYFSLCLIFSLLLVPTHTTLSPGHALQAIEGSWLLLGVPAGLLGGLLIGSRSIGTEIGGGSGDFVMTRPKPRKYFIWSGWAVGVVEIFAIVVITALFKQGLLYYEDGPFWRSLPAAIVDIPVLIASVTVFTLVVYSTTYFASVLTRKSGAAIGIGLGFCIAYQVIVNRLGWVHSHLPDMLIVPYKPLRGEYVRGNAIHDLVPWIIFVLLLPLLAQLIFEKSEI